MAELLLEILSEEIPARMQAKAEGDLLKALTEALDATGLARGEARAWSGPRRLGVCVADLAEASADVREERKGPRVGAPDKAVQGFLRGAGLASIEDAEIVSDPKKGDFYQAVIERPGRPAADIVAEAVPVLIRGFPWPKSMRWGRGDLRWVRPIRRILCVLGGDVVPFEVGGIASGEFTEGHRVHGRGPFKTTSFASYQNELETLGSVRLDRGERRALIADRAKGVCAKAGLELVEDQGLLEEVAGLVEWPVVILGEMDPEFLDLPPEVIRLTMRAHQKYFAVRDPKTGDLAPRFVVVANVEAKDGGETIAAGNARVLSARLKDARFFYENDLATPLEAMADKLKTITFHQKLGTLADKTERVAALARALAPKVGADPDLAERAARLAKADLVSEMVYEFPELQGVMGRYYTLEQAKSPAIVTPEKPQASSGAQGGGEGAGDGSRIDAGASSGMTNLLSGLTSEQVAQIADAIRDHYKPQGPSDAVPTAPVSVALALADKLDTLVGFWAINEKPTGSGDPFALRRAALGVIRIVIETGVRLELQGVCFGSYERIMRPVCEANWMSDSQRGGPYSFEEFAAPENRGRKFELDIRVGSGVVYDGQPMPIHRVYWPTAVASQLLAFFADRLKVHLRNEGQRHDLIDAVFALGEDDLVLIVKRVEALGRFLDSDDGANLLAGYKRAANILRAEEKKDGRAYEGAPDPKLFSQDEERNLHQALQTARGAAADALEREDFEQAMAHLASLRGPVDGFFDRVTVNTDETKTRANRLQLLAAMREALHAVADFSKIEG